MKNYKDGKYVLGDLHDGRVGFRKRTNSNLRIKVSKDYTVNLCMVVVLYTYLIGFFTYNFGMSESLLYVTDALLLMIIIGSIRRLFKVAFLKEMRFAGFLLLALVMVGVFSAFVNGFHFSLWVWSLRNWGRFFCFFYIVIGVLDKSRIDWLLNFTEKLFHVNFIVIIIQYILFHGSISQDALNGLVGRTTSGANMILILATFIIIFSKYMDGKYRINKVVGCLLEIAVISILAELKAVILFVAIILAFMMLCNSRLNGRTVVRALGLGIACALVVVLVLKAIASFYPIFANISSIEGIIRDLTAEGGYGNNGYINRLTGISVINRYFFNGYGTFSKLFGIGMGNGEYSSVAFLTSSFYKAYGETFKYLRFSLSSLYLEVGISGVILFVAFHLTVLGKCFRNVKHAIHRQEAVFYENIGLGMTLLATMYIWYNNLHRTDLSVLLALYMAVPFAVKYHQKKAGQK